MAGRHNTTTKDIGLLKQLFDDQQLQISAEFQRNAVWPRAAKAYLIDSILSDSPIPVLYFQRRVSAQTNRIEYTVVDGQQRLNAVLQFMDNRFSLTESDESANWYKKRWKTLSDDERMKILSYDFVVQELVGYSADNIRDMFQRMNRYVVALNPQERRHASEDGEFKKIVEEIGAWSFWLDNRVLTKGAANRMKADEFAAELIILQREGPQDKKESVDLYYDAYGESFPDGAQLRDELMRHLSFVSEIVPNLDKSPLRRVPNIYALIGALNEITSGEEAMPETAQIRERLGKFADELALPADNQPTRASQYQVAQSRQTDNIRPRRERIEILRSVILGSD